jgi:hypothetical protein
MRCLFGTGKRAQTPTRHRAGPVGLRRSAEDQFAGAGAVDEGDRLRRAGRSVACGRAALDGAAVRVAAARRGLRPAEGVLAPSALCGLAVSRPLPRHSMVAAQPSAMPLASSTSRCATSERRAAGGITARGSPEAMPATISGSVVALVAVEVGGVAVIASFAMAAPLRHRAIHIVERERGAIVRGAAD